MLSTRTIVKTWWPLAASWLLMAAELPALSAVVARLADPEIHLAAYGGVVFPIALIIESPIIMLLAASTALSKDYASYQRLYRYMMLAGGVLTALHIAIAFSPLYDLLAVGVMGAPAEIIEPGRIGLMIMTPWTWTIAYRRFHQGVMIRFNRSRLVGTGTLVRLGTNILTLTVGYLLNLPGIVVGASSVALGVTAEAIYAGLAVQPILRGELRNAPPTDQPVSLPFFLRFYIPLVFTSLLSLLVQPIGSAAISRMPLTLQSLAIWPAMSGFLFLFRSPGIAYNEVVVALLDRPGAARPLRRFSLGLGLVTSLALLLISLTPLSRLWFGGFSGLRPELASMAAAVLWLAVPVPLFISLQSWYQGLILHGKATRSITEAVVIFLGLAGGVLLAGVYRNQASGLSVALAAFTIATIGQTIWLWWRSRGMTYPQPRLEYKLPEGKGVKPPSL